MRGCAGVLLVAHLAAAGCARDARMGEEVPAGGGRPAGARQAPLQPGTPVGVAAPAENPYAGDPQALVTGERLYNWMNCSGCHFAGGGGIGPALMDDDWIYGDRPGQIFDVIVNGRPNGMPAYGDKLEADQIWHIVAHVQSLSQRAEEADGR